MHVQGTCTGLYALSIPQEQKAKKHAASGIFSLRE